MTLTSDLGGHRDCQSRASEYFVRVPSANSTVWPTRVRHTMWPSPLTLRGHRAWHWCELTTSIHTPTLKFLGLTSRKIWHILCVCVSRPVTLTFDLLTLKLLCNVARVMGYPAANFGDTTTIHFRFMGYWANTAKTDITWPCDLDLRPWRSLRLWLTWVVVLHPCNKFEVHRPCYSEDMAHGVCQY